MGHRYPGMEKNRVRINNGSYVYTLPKPIAQELELEHGDEPQDIEWDDEGREVVLKF
jgi:hypothetical protein